MNRKPTFHQKQIRFFTVFFGVLVVFLAIGLIWIANRLTLGGH